MGGFCHGFCQGTDGLICYYYPIPSVLCALPHLEFVTWIGFCHIWVGSLGFVATVGVCQIWVGFVAVFVSLGLSNMGGRICQLWGVRRAHWPLSDIIT